MKAPIFLQLGAALAMLMPLRGADSSGLIREQGAIYLKDFLKKPMTVEVLSTGPVFYDPGKSRYLGTLQAGQMVELQAIADGAYRVRGRAQQGQVAGWIDPKHLRELAEKFLKDLQMNAARKMQIRELIEKNEIAINMTPEEVKESIGKPQRTSSRVDIKGRQDVWEYVTYQRVRKPVRGFDEYGREVVSYVTVKEPAGQMAVVFQNGLVAAIEQTEGTLSEAGAKIINAPLVFQ